MTLAERRDFWTRIHRWLGLAAMLFLAIAAITGCILSYAQPIDAAINADLFKREVDGRRVGSIEAVATFQREHPDIQVLSFPLNVPDDRNIVVNVAAKPGADAIAFDQLFLDRGDGGVVGVRSSEPGWGRRGIVAAIAEFHFNLLAGDWGRWLMGVMAFLWLISVPVGAYLTFPRKRPFFGNWRRMWRFSFKSSLPRMLLDIHRASGLWLLIGVFVLAFTSVALNFFDELYAPAAVEIAPLERSLFDEPEPFPEGTTPTLGFADAIGLATAHAEQVGQTWRPATMLYMPAWNLYGVTFTDDGVLNYRALGPVYYYFDAVDGRFVHDVDPYGDSAGLVMIRMLYPLHSGQVGGPITVFIVFLLGLATLEMCVTGFYVWWKKRRSRVAARAARARLALS